MSNENGFNEKISEHILKIVKNSSLFERISNLTNKANKTIYGVGSFCLVVSLFTIINYNKTKFTIEFIQNQLSNILDISHHKNKNIENISEKVADIEEKITKMNDDIFYIKMELKNLTLFLNYNWNSGKKYIEKSTSMHPLDFLSLEEICGENYQEKDIQKINNEDLNMDNIKNIRGI